MRVELRNEEDPSREGPLWDGIHDLVDSADQHAWPSELGRLEEKPRMCLSIDERQEVVVRREDEVVFPAGGQNVLITCALKVHLRDRPNLDPSAPQPSDHGLEDVLVGEEREQSATAFVVLGYPSPSESSLRSRISSRISSGWEW